MQAGHVRQTSKCDEGLIAIVDLRSGRSSVARTAKACGQACEEEVERASNSRLPDDGAPPHKGQSNAGISIQLSVALGLLFVSAITTIAAQMTGMTKRMKCQALLLSVLLPLGLASCAGLEHADQGRLQPQSVTGPCHVKKFFLTGLTATNTNMSVSSDGSACTFTLINPDLQIFNTAALVTSQPTHGHTNAGLTTGGTQATVSYNPQSGYAGPDQFTVTLEPEDRAVTVNVAVQPRVAQGE